MVNEADRTEAASNIATIEYQFECSGI